MILGELKGVVSSSSALGRVKTQLEVSISSSICSAALDPEDEEEEDAEELAISCSVVVMSKGEGEGENEGLKQLEGQKAKGQLDGSNSRREGVRRKSGLFFSSL